MKEVMAFVETRLSELGFDWDRDNKHDDEIYSFEPDRPEEVAKLVSDVKEKFGKELLTYVEDGIRCIHVSGLDF